MSRLEVRLLDRILYASGDVLLRAELHLLLKDATGRWQPAVFRVDTGSEMTTMPAFAARQLGLPMPLHPVRGARHEQTGLEFRSGYLRVQVVGLSARECAFPCFFLGDPNTPPNPNTPQAQAPKNLLGTPGVIKQLRIYLDGDATPTAPYGVMVVEEK